MSIFGAIGRLISRQTKEQARVVEALDVFARYVPTAAIHTAVVLDQVVKDCKHVVVRSDDARKMLVDQPWTPLDAAAVFVLVYCKGKLSSGEHHTYRGILSSQGVGYRVIYNAAIDRLVAGGRISSAKADDAREEIAELIAEAG